jgi:hypothetical protein
VAAMVTPLEPGVGGRRGTAAVGNRRETMAGCDCDCDCDDEGRRRVVGRGSEVRPCGGGGLDVERRGWRVGVAAVARARGGPFSVGLIRSVPL